METTTVNRMNLLFQPNTKRINCAIPAELKKQMTQAEKDLNIGESQFIKLAIVEKLNRIYQE
jgi:hypothetical protein